MGRIKGWWHRRAVECAVSDVKHWRSEFLLLNSVAAIFLLLGLIRIISAELGGLIGLGIGVFFMSIAWKFGIPGRMRRATHEERVLIVAKEYKVPIAEVRAGLEGRK